MAWATRGEKLFEGFSSQIVAIVDSDDYLNNLIFNWKVIFNLLFLTFNISLAI